MLSDILRTLIHLIEDHFVEFILLILSLIVLDIAINYIHIGGGDYYAVKKREQPKDDKPEHKDRD